MGLDELAGNGWGFRRSKGMRSSCLQLDVVCVSRETEWSTLLASGDTQESDGGRGPKQD